MIKFSRIQKICSLVDCKYIAEIGADHAYITKTLFDSKKINGAIVTDISQKCLQKAINNLKPYKNKVIFSVGNGLNAIENVEMPIGTTHLETAFKNVDNINKQLKTTLPKPKTEIIIAGMGGQEIIKILQQDEKKQYENFILQPQKNVVELRTFLQQNNFRVLTDDLVQEGKMFYYILKVKRENKQIPLNTLQTYFGNPQDKQVFKNYLTFELEKREEISKQKKLLENETLIRIIKECLNTL